ncbi:hypothetical protein L798_02174 [Zootermopsis nevadensis]|uniref:Uncharacterized protein n=1 Tax=Zootermopsis nevadensis TaxID=136037 RepID=A0A067RT74_ZOONE|nr:hypothetical protein L798_02174 [Zootermopsis nevadensis]
MVIQKTQQPVVFISHCEFRLNAAPNSYIKPDLPLYSNRDIKCQRSCPVVKAYEAREDIVEVKFAGRIGQRAGFVSESIECRDQVMMKSHGVSFVAVHRSPCVWWEYETSYFGIPTPR